MNPLTHKFYRWLLKWYVTIYRPANPLLPAVHGEYTQRYILTRYVLYATFYLTYPDCKRKCHDAHPCDGKSKWVLSHIHIHSAVHDTYVVELY